MIYRRLGPVLMFAAIGACTATAADLPEWTRKIRPDHPRLFFNADTWPAVKARALGKEADWFERFRSRVDRSLKRKRGDEPADRGVEAARAAFVYLVTDKVTYLAHAKACLNEALDHYELRFRQKRTVNWYSTSRVHAVLAWDWLYNAMSAEERRTTMTRLVNAVDAVLQAKPHIHRENYSGYNTGFYGIRNVLWFLACAAYGTGIEPERVNPWLVWGYNENHKLLEHRRRACSDDGGGASPTLGYIFGAYPWSEQNFFYTWFSATGQNIAPDWPHSAWLAHYVVWNWITGEKAPLEYGYGDTPHMDNVFPTWQLFTHMANIRHLYAKQLPQAAALAGFVQTILPKRHQRHTDTWFIYPFLLTGADTPVPDVSSLRLPHARNFENMGQVFMRSGVGVDDTYCLFTCGGVLAQHRHFDALNFVVYHRGHLALDSGTRFREQENGEHLANYYAQTVAHNCILVHQPNEPYARYWGGTVTQIHGGQHKQTGSVFEAFETNDRFVYVAGDATACYRHNGKTADGKHDLPQKVSLVTRQMVFLMPNHFVVFDRVRSTDAAYRKQWLLHTAYKPDINGKTVRADHGKGRLFCRTLLPEDARLTLVGGPGHRFEAGGRNWNITTGKLRQRHIAMMGQWRVEVTPGTSRRNDVFLHVLQVGTRDMTEPLPATVVAKDGMIGAKVVTAAGVWEVLFAAEGDLAGHIRGISDDSKIDRPLASTVTPQKGITTVKPPEQGIPLSQLREHSW